MKTMRTDAQRDIKTIVVGVLFIILGLVVINDTTNYVDADSYVFPRTIAITLIVLSLALVILKVVRPGVPAEEPEPGSTPRRIGLLVAMLAASAAMPYLGFFLSGLAAFVAIMALAMFDPWTRRRLVFFGLVSVAVVAGFYGLFAGLLQVPLPIGTVFG
jgi:putative tricarboxylic transport membrane protein